MAGEVRRLTRPHDPAEALVGARLRAARQAAGLTLAAVAAQAGLTKGFLSRLERDEVSPSVASLVTVCGVLGIGVGQLFEPPTTSLVRAAEAPPINFGGRGLREVLLTAGTQRDLQVIRSVVEPGGGGGEELYALACEVEFVHVLRGRLRLLLPGQSVDLDEGDAFTMPGATPHTWFNPSATTVCEVLWALTPAP
ncbi:XRE family transcriptional regulator [Geodermatophilus sp. TF02-6]|uniref:helix-turn-helix domain-containing protein n=1 Tax=Geodermatophilus sp. TF02-6 TaxID=2250575 RepID=UPI000DEA58F6|nr:helix-turn-helix domain-containing protein [Geodermatophilus sp. TF02-6]RBY74659.1 XRE family transcriptional regulator [Geodermatophilus sp. TF02-6]